MEKVAHGARNLPGADQWGEGAKVVVGAGLDIAWRVQALYASGSAR